MNKKIYVLATVHKFGNGTVSVLLDHFSDFNDAKSLAIANADAQVRIEGESFVGKWEHDEHACEIARYNVPSFDFNNPLFLIETVSKFMGAMTKTYRAVFEYDLKIWNQKNI